MKISSIVEYLCNQFDSKEFEKDILKYGLEVLIYNFLTLSILIVLSLIFKNLDFGFIFIPSFTLLRITIGGFHCKTIFGCTTLMITIYTIINYLVSLANYNDFLKIFSPLLIFLLLFIKPCAENTLCLKKFDIYLNYILIVIFILDFVILSNTHFFLPSFSALLVTELMYFTYLLKTSI